MRVGLFRLFFFAALVLTSGAHGQLCPQWLLTLGQATAQWIRPEIRPWNRYRYEIARAQAARGEFSLSELDTPEKLFAFVDHLTPERPFQSQIAAIEALGGKVRFKNYRLPLKLERDETLFDWRWVPRAPDARLKSEWRLYHGLPYRSREAISIITVANAPPTSHQEMMDWVLEYSSALALQRLRLRAGYSGWLSGLWSFSAQSLSELEAAESDQYSALTALQSAFPDTQPALPKTDGIWIGRHLQTALGLPLRILWPSYNALAPYRANLEGLRAWQSGSLHAHLRSRYEARLRWKWLIDRYRHCVLATTLLLAPSGVYNTAQNFLSAELWDRLGQMEKDIQAIPERYAAPRVNEDIRSYHQTPGGDPIINEHYNSQIREIQAAINLSGDPDGKLQRQIDKLIQTRDLLNH
jgi:hypothetical protein